MHHFLNQIEKKGFCVVRNIFSQFDVDGINQNIKRYLMLSHEGVVREKGTTVVRAIHGLHLFDSFFMRLAQSPFFIKIAQQYLSDEVYIHQYKVNMKSSMQGQSWPWHQDFVYWKEGDYIESPRLLNIAVALDDISMLSGPLCVIPSSHKYGNLTSASTVSKSNWSKDVSSDLTYQIKRDGVASLIEKNGYEFLVCSAGDIIVFHPQLAHASSNNLSPHERRLLLITYNAVSNAPAIKSKRPNFLSAVDFTPLTTEDELWGREGSIIRGRTNDS